MKYFTSIALLFIMMGYSFIQLGTFFEYVVDIEAYTDKYCINKEKPEQNCNGKCHLTVELAKNEKQHQKSKTLSIPEILLFHAEKQIEIPEVKLFEKVGTSIFNYLPFYTEDVYYSISAPPEV